ncbi:HEAT repeat domain-containing protein [bacterium]|nr:HEAT repeat domain-containing protein [bacterium]
MKDRRRDAADIATLMTGNGNGFKVRASIVNIGILSCRDRNGLRLGRTWEGETQYKGFQGGDFSNLIYSLEMAMSDREPDPRGKRIIANGVLCLSVPIYWYYIPTTEEGACEYMTDIEMVLAFRKSVRVGVNPGEMLDYVLGWTTLDLYGDDIAKSEWTEEHGKAYWEDAFKTGKLDGKDAAKFLTGRTRTQIGKALEKQDPSDAVRAVLVRLVLEEEGMEKIGLALCNRAKLTEEEAVKLHGWQVKRDDLAAARLLAANPATPVDILELLADSEDVRVLTRVLGSKRLPKPTQSQVVSKLVRVDSRRVSFALAACEATPPELLARLAEDENDSIVRVVARNPSTPPAVLRKLALAKSQYVRCALAQNPGLPHDVSVTLAKDENPHVRRAIALNQKTPVDVLEGLVSDTWHEVRMNLTKNPSTPVRLLERLARDESRLIRAAAREALNSRESKERDADEK